MWHYDSPTHQLLSPPIIYALYSIPPFLKSSLLSQTLLHHFSHPHQIHALIRHLSISARQSSKFELLSYFASMRLQHPSFYHTARAHQPIKRNFFPKIIPEKRSSITKYHCGALLRSSTIAQPLHLARSSATYLVMNEKRLPSLTVLGLLRNSPVPHQPWLGFLHTISHRTCRVAYLCHGHFHRMPPQRFAKPSVLADC